MMTRRSFLAHGSALSTVLLAAPLFQTTRRYKMGLQLYTMRAAMGRDVQDTLKRVAAKDMHKVSRDYTELGNGSIDFTKIWPDTKLAGLEHFFVEQGGNFTYDPFRSISDSAEYVKRNLLK